MKQSRLFIDLNLVVQIRNYIDALNVWKTWKQSVSQTNQEKHNYFSQYFRAIKPVVYKFSQIQKLNPKQYAFYSNQLNCSQISQLKQLFEPLRQFQIVDKNDPKIQQLKNNSLNFVKDLFKAPQNPIYKIDLNSQPQNNETKFWANTIKMPKIQIQGLIIKGKGIAAKDLGMPTANIELSEQSNRMLIEYPNAIYATIIKMESGEQFLGAACLGTNPHYQNTKSHRFLQIYILNDFKQIQFYGQTLVVQFLELIRLQAKFGSFDQFLNGMRNDIEITKNFKSQLNIQGPKIPQSK